MALIYRWFTWVYLLKMGGFSMAPKQSIHQVQVGQSVPEPEKLGHVGHGEARYSQYSYIACKCPSSKWQFIMTDRYLWHLMALMFGYVLPRPEFHYFLWNIPGDRGIFHLGDQNCLNSTDLTFLFVDVCCKQISVYNIRDCNGGCWQSNSCTGQL